MGKYVNVYWFNVIAEVQKGKEVFVIDRLIHEVLAVGTLPVKTLANILTLCEKEEHFGRYEFYYVEEEGVTENG